MDTTALKIVVIGGGIGGLAAALALRNVGCAVQVYERTPYLREVGAGLSLWGNAVRALQQLGLGEQVQQHSVVDVAGGIRNTHGELLAATDMREVQEKVGAPTVIMHRATLHGLLLAALDPAQVHLGATCVGYQQDATSVTAQFADGRHIQADVLIGADGIHSAVRTALHGQQPVRSAGCTAWRAVVDFPAERLLPGESWGAGTRFGQAPMGENRTYWFATMRNDQRSTSDGSDKALLLQTFADYHAPVVELIERTDEATILRNEIVDRPPLHHWGEGRMTLLGDAAHPTTPNLGQGACQALEDAVVLARCLQRKADVAAGLRQYERLRIPRTTQIVKTSWQLGMLGNWKNPLATTLRDQLFKHVLARLQTRQIVQLVGYDF